MNRLNKLLQKRAKLIADARKILDKEGATAEELGRADEMMNDADAMEDDVKRAERHLNMERRNAERQAPNGSVVPTGTESGGTGSPEGGEARTQEQLQLAGFRSFLNPDAQADPEAEREFRAISAGTDAQGGYLVAPEQFVNELIQEIDDLVWIRSLSTTRTVTESDKLGVPSLDADPSDPTWTTEILTGDDDSAMRTGKREWEPHPLAKRIKVSRKLIRASALPVEQIVRERLAYVQSITQEKAFMSGSGNGQPLGIFAATTVTGALPATRDVATDNTATAITSDGLINAQFHLKAGYRRNANWVFHRDAVRNIRKLKDSNGQYIWQASLQVGEPSMLLGSPVRESEFAPNTFTTGLYVGIFADFKYYWIVDALDMQIQRLVELYAETKPDRLHHALRARRDARCGRGVCPGEAGLTVLTRHGTQDG